MISHRFNNEDLFNQILDKYQNIYVYEEVTIINSLGSYLINYANKFEKRA